MTKIKRWYTIREFIDIETGEIINKEQEQDYIKVGNEIKYDQSEKYNIKKILVYGKVSRQQKLF